MSPPYLLIVIWFNPSEDYLEDPQSFHDQVVAQKSHGIRGIYHGPQLGPPVEDGGAWVIVWKSAEHQLRFMQSVDYANYLVPVMDAFTGSIDSTNVLCPSEQHFSKILIAPVTEFVYITLKDKHNPEELSPRLADLEDALLGTHGYQGSCHGLCGGSDTSCVWIGAWTSIDAHHRAAKDKTVAAAWHKIRDSADIERKYAELQLTDR